MLRRAPTAPLNPRRRERPRPGPWLLLFTLGLVLRLLVVVAPSGSGPDASLGEGALGEVTGNLARGDGFSLNGPTGPVATAALPPLVPWLAALAYRSLGHRPFAVLLLQCVIGALGPLLLGSLGAAMFGASIGRVAAWLAAVSPVLVLPAQRLGVGPTFAVCVLAALAAGASWVKTPRPARALGLGLILGFATLAHTTAIVLPAIIAVWAWTPLGLTVTVPDRTRQVALMVLGLVVVVAPWAARNAIALKAPLLLSTSVGHRLLEGNNPVVFEDRRLRGSGMDVTGIEPYRSALGPPGARAPMSISSGSAPSGDHPPASGASREGEAARDLRAAGLAWRFLAGRPRDWPALTLAKIGRLWTPGALGVRGVGSAGGGAAPALVWIWSLLALPLALYGLGRTLVSARRWFQSLAALVILALMVVVVVFYAAPLLRLSIEPLALLFAAAGLEDVRRRLRTRGRGLKVIEGRR